MKTKFPNIVFLVYLATIVSGPLEAGKLEFKESLIDHTGGGAWAQTGVADMDGDGWSDYISGNWDGIWWWRNPGEGKVGWEKNTIADWSPTDVGGAPMDVDEDGDMDWVSSQYWFRNDGEAEMFTPVEYGPPTKDHDVDLVDIDGDGRLDILRSHDGITQWARNPGKDKVDQKWVHTTIVKGYNGGDKLHGATSPKGWGDIDKDGDIDIVTVKLWFENVDGKGASWLSHEYTSWGEIGKYGWEFRTWVDDLDGDDDLDIAISEGDAKDGTAAWIENVDGKGGSWKTHELPTGGVKGDMHSIAALDFDNDGDRDIFVGQNGGGDQNEWMVFENTDGKGAFKKHVILKTTGAHETVYVDYDKDGDIDIISKCWCSDARHVLAENLLK